MHGNMPDHPAETRAIGTHAPGLFLALDVEQPDNMPTVLGDELDRWAVVALLLAAHVVEECGAEKRQDAAPDPAGRIFCVKEP